MGRRTPKLSEVLVSVAFAFSCFGLMIFLWTAFGGPVPLAPEGYQFRVPFDEATQLAVESDVRISNVSVGKVKEIELDKEAGVAEATVELDDAYSPIPANSRAILRQKTLLGETYVELSEGNPGGGDLPEGGALPAAQVSDAVQLDEIFRTFDARTRAAFQTWMQQLAIASTGRGADLSAAIANLEPFAEDANRVLRVLDTQGEAVSQLINNTGVVFGALSERKGQLRSLIRNSATVFSTTARRDEDLKGAFVALPTFLDESRATLTRLERFADDTDPLILQLRPAARELSGTLRQVARLSPDLRGFFAGFRRLANRSKAGLPALRQLLAADLPPVLTQLQSFLRQVTPIVTATGRYKREITAFLGNVTAATQAFNAVPESNNLPVHYLRGSSPLSPEALAVFSTNRLQSNRTNAYVAPGGSGLFGGRQSFETRQCAVGINAQLNQAITVGDPDFDARATLSDGQDLFDRLKQFAFNNNPSTTAVSTPPCIQQGKQSSIGQIPELTDYLHVYQDAP